MRSIRLRLVALLLCLLLLLPNLSGCAAFDAYRLFFSGEGTKDPAAGAVPTPPADGLSALTLGYDEGYTLPGRFLAVEDIVTGDQTLLSVEEDAEAGSFTVRSVGVGSATLVYEVEGAERRLPVTVKPARLAVFFLFGDSDARGVKADSSSAMRAADGRVYYTFPEYARRFVPETVDEFVPPYLTENVFSKAYTNLFCRTNELTVAGRGRYAGLSAPLAYKWAEQTGEHVWIINLAEEGTSILDLLPDATTPDGAANDFACLEALFASITETLTREYDAGHYTHARTGYFLAQGEKDAAMNAADYLAALTTLHTALKDALTFTYTAPDGQNHAFELDFGGIFGSRAARTGGIGAAVMTGPRAAQMTVAGAGEALSDLYLLTDTASAWYNDSAVEAHFARYDRRKFVVYYGYQPPSTVRDLVTAEGAYTEAARNELAALAVENLLYISGLQKAPATTPTLSLLAYNGVDKVEDHLLLSYGADTVAAVPSVSPLWMAKEVGATVTLTATGHGADLCRMKGLSDGQSVTLAWSGSGVSSGEESLPVRKILRFAFSDYPAELVEDPENGQTVLQGYSSFYSCGYIARQGGAYTPFPAYNYRSGWLYDGRTVFGGHGGIQASRHYLFGPDPDWDCAYAFTAPAGGTATVSFNAIYPGKNDYLLAIRLNGEQVWPQGGDAAAFYTVRTDATLAELNGALSGLSLTLEAGDVLTFVCRRGPSGLSAEGAVHPVVTIWP